MKVISKFPNRIVLLFAILLVGLLCNILFFSLNGYTFWYDEAIYLAIASSNNYSDLINSVRYEPNGVGSYFLMHLILALSRGSIITTRIMLLIITYFLIFAALLRAYRKQVLYKYKLTFGLALYFATATFVSIQFNLKVHQIGQALSIMIVLLFFEIIDSKRISNFKLCTLNFMFLLLFISDYPATLCLSIIYIPWLVYSYYTSRSKIYMGLILINLVVFLMYFFGFMYGQILNNLNRSVWFNYGNPSIIRFFLMMYASRHPGSYMTDIFVVSTLALMWIGRKVKFKFEDINQLYFKYGIYGYSVCLLFIGYFSGLLVLDRYMYVLVLLISIFAGWGIDFLIEVYPKYRNKFKIVLTCFFVTIFCYSLITVTLIYRSSIDGERGDLEFITKSNKNLGHDIGLIVDYQMIAHYYKQLYLYEYENIKVVNLYSKELISDEPGINGTHLSTDAKVEFESSDDRRDVIESNLSASNYNDFIYLKATTPGAYYYDDGDLVIDLFKSHCENLDIGSRGFIGYGLHVTGCDFN